MNLTALVISDFHGAGHVLSPMEKVIQDISPHFLIFSGDIVKGYARGDEWLMARDERRTPHVTDEIRAEKEEDEKFYQQFFSFLEELSIPSFIVPGNMDAPEKRFLRFCLPEISVHRFQIGTYSPQGSDEDVVITGFGGELTETQDEEIFVLNYSRSTVIDSLDLKAFPDHPFALITHSPPVSPVSKEDGQEKGSTIVNDLLDILRPRYLFCGHAHRSHGTHMIGTTRVVNPGALKYGNYAVVKGDAVEFRRL